MIMAIAWRITRRCNLGKCFFCRIGDKAKNSDGELSFEKVKDICSQYASSDYIDKGIKKIYFTGGEPFIREDMADILNYITVDLQIPASVVTNGTLINDNNIYSLKNSLIDISISLDGLEDVHNNIRQSKVFNKTINTIANLLENGITVDVLPTVTRCSYDSLLSDEFIRLLTKQLKGIRYIAFSQIFSLGYGKYWQSENVSKEKYKNLLQYYKKIAIDFKVIERKPKPPSLRIDCYGNVHSLSEMEGIKEFIDGNLCKSSLDSLLFPPSFFWLFNKSRYSKERIILELAYCLKDCSNNENNLSYRIIQQLNQDRYLA